jgi:outer membrane protein assembly factor BamB
MKPGKVRSSAFRRRRVKWMQAAENSLARVLRRAQRRLKPELQTWFVFALLLSATAFAAPPSWPQFRGANASGVASDAKPPEKFGPSENVLWQIDLPVSPSSPCIWGDHIFLTTYDQGKFQVRDYRRSDGENRWARGFTVPALEEFHATEGSPAASTPATDGRRVVSYFGSFGLVCQNYNGLEIWRAAMPPAQTAGGFGSGTSPIIVANKVILNRDQQANSKIMAFDLETGKKLWETARAGSPTSYTTPVVWKKDNRLDIIVAGSLSMKGYEAQNGELLWTVRGLPSYTCTTPVVNDDMIYFAGWSPGKSDSPWPSWQKFLEQHDKNKDGRISLEEFGDEKAWFRSMDVDNDGFVTSADWDKIEALMNSGQNTMLAVKAGGAGDITETHVAWKSNRGLPYVPSPLYYDGNVYIVKDGGMLSCFDVKTGEARYSQERLDANGSYYASPVAADGRVFLASVNGRVTVVKAGGTKPEILHQADFKERIAATMAIVEANIYLRTQTKLYAFGAPSSKAEK